MVPSIKKYLVNRGTCQLKSGIRRFHPNHYILYPGNKYNSQDLTDRGDGFRFNLSYK